MTLNSQARPGKHFLLGLGAQKAGTTWLYSELKNSSQFKPGITKEYHVFDAVYTQEAERIRSRLRRKLSQPAPRRGKRAAMLLSFINNPSKYFDYFSKLLSENPNTLLTADITPAYSLLSSEELRFVKNSFLKRDIPIKVVFFMRDPVERVWSAARMELRNKTKRGLKGEISIEDEVGFLKRFYTRKSVELRTRYDLIINNINSVFRSNEVYYDFYEQLFTHERINTLRDFIQLEDFSPKTNRTYNASPKRGEIPDALRRAIKDHYKHVYSFVRDEFGEDSVKLWG